MPKNNKQVTKHDAEQALDTLRADETAFRQIYGSCVFDTCEALLIRAGGEKEKPRYKRPSFFRTRSA